jgi:predicted RNase H-like HicB family nuclease
MIEATIGEKLLRKKINFTVLIEKDEDGIFIASVPSLKGCHTQAKTYEELIPRITEAIQLYIDTDGEDSVPNEFVGIQKLQIEI